MELRYLFVIALVASTMANLPTDWWWETLIKLGTAIYLAFWCRDINP